MLKYLNSQPLYCARAPRARQPRDEARFRFISITGEAHSCASTNGRSNHSRSGGDDLEEERIRHAKSNPPAPVPAGTVAGPGVTGTFRARARRSVKECRAECLVAFRQVRREDQVGDLLDRHPHGLLRVRRLDPLRVEGGLLLQAHTRDESQTSRNTRHSRRRWHNQAARAPAMAPLLAPHAQRERDPPTRSRRRRAARSGAC